MEGLNVGVGGENKRIIEVRVRTCCAKSAHSKNKTRFQGASLMCELHKKKHTRENPRQSQQSLPDSVAGLVIPDQKSFHTSMLILLCRLYSTKSVFG